DAHTSTLSLRAVVPRLLLFFITSFHHSPFSSFFFFNDTPTTEIYTFPTRRSSDLPEADRGGGAGAQCPCRSSGPDQIQGRCGARSEEHTSELQSRGHLVCRLLLEKKKKKKQIYHKINKTHNDGKHSTYIRTSSQRH